MSGEIAALSLACGIGFATVCCPVNDQRVCCGPGFRMAAEASSAIRQGESQTIDVIFERHPDFDTTLRLQATAPRDVHASLSAKRMSKDNDRVQLTLTVDADSPLGCRIVTVVAYSDYRQVVSIPVRIWVEPNWQKTER